MTIITNHTETAYTPGKVILSKYEQKWHKIMALYLDLTVLVRNATEMLFPSKRFTKDIVRTGKYVALVEHFGQVLSAWERGSEELNKYKGVQGKDQEKELEKEGVLIPKPFWKVLRIEYCYARIFVYCIALEAVGERREKQQMEEREKAKDKDNEKDEADASKGKDAVRGAGPGMLGGSFLGGAFGEEEIDWDFIQMAFSSGLEILSIVTAGGEEPSPGAGPADANNPPSAIPWLRFAPVRVYVRIIFAAIFLLKATALLLSLGPGIAPQTTRAAILAQSKKCLHMLSRTVEALRRCAVDDVHLANTFAELLGMHIEVLRWRVYPRPSTRGGHGVHARGGRGGGVGRGGGLVGANVTPTGGPSTSSPPGAKPTVPTAPVEKEEVDVVFPPTPAGMRDDDNHDHKESTSTAMVLDTVKQEAYPGGINTYNTVVSPTVTLTHGISPSNIPSNSPNMLSPLLTPGPIIDSALAAPNLIPSFPAAPSANSIWALGGSNLLDFTTPPIMGGGGSTLSSAPGGPGGGDGDWDNIPGAAGMEDAGILGAGAFNVGGGGPGGGMGLQGVPGGGQGDGNADMGGLGTYGMPGTMEEEEGVMDFLWDYSMGGGGLS